VEIDARGDLGLAPVVATGSLCRIAADSDRGDGQRDRPPGKVFRHGKTRVRDGISRVGRLPMQRLGVVDSLGTPCCFSDAAKPTRFRRQTECVHSRFGRGTSIVRLIARMALPHDSFVCLRAYI
jgi:hypothetical protein